MWIRRGRLDGGCGSRETWLMALVCPGNWSRSTRWPITSSGNRTSQRSPCFCKAVIRFNAYFSRSLQVSSATRYWLMEIVLRKRPLKKKTLPNLSIRRNTSSINMQFKNYWLLKKVYFIYRILCFINIHVYHHSFIGISYDNFYIVP